MNSTACANLGLSVGHSDSSTPGARNIHMAAAFTFIPLSGFTVAANGTIIVSLLLSLFRNPGQRFAVNVSLVKTLMISMAVSDAIIGCFSMPLAIYELFMYGHWELGQSLCTIKQTVDVFLCTVSIYHVTCMAVDRYLAVCRPLTYRTLTINSGYSMIGVSWAVPAALSLVPFLGDWHTEGVQEVVVCYQLSSYCSIIFNLPYQVTSALISFYIPMVTICILYYLIARQVWLASERFSRMAFRNSILRLRRNLYSLSNKSRQRETSAKSLSEMNVMLSGKELENQSNKTMSQAMCASSQNVSENATNFSEYSGLVKCNSRKQLEHQCFECNSGKQLEHQCFECNSGEQLEHQCFESNSGEQTEHQCFECNYREQIEHEGFKSGTYSLPTPDHQRGISADHQRGNSADHQRGISADHHKDISADHQRGISAAVSAQQNGGPGCLDVGKQGNSARSHCNHARMLAGKELRTEKSVSCERIIESNGKNSTKLRLFHEQRASSDQQNSDCAKRKPRDKHKTGFGKMKAVGTIGSVVVCFTVCWMPFSVYIVIESYYNYSLPLWPYVALTWLGYLNSALNPVLYCGNRSIRQAVRSCMFRYNTQTTLVDDL